MSTNPGISATRSSISPNVRSYSAWSMSSRVQMLNRTISIAPPGALGRRVMLARQLRRVESLRGGRGPQVAQPPGLPDDVRWAVGEPAHVDPSAPRLRARQIQLGTVRMSACESEVSPAFQPGPVEVQRGALELHPLEADGPSELRLGERDDPGEGGAVETHGVVDGSLPAEAGPGEGYPAAGVASGPAAKGRTLEVDGSAEAELGPAEGDPAAGPEGRAPEQQLAAPDGHRVEGHPECREPTALQGDVAPALERGPLEGDVRRPRERDARQVDVADKPGTPERDTAGIDGDPAQIGVLEDDPGEVEVAARPADSGRRGEPRTQQVGAGPTLVAGGHRLPVVVDRA